MHDSFSVYNRNIATRTISPLIGGNQRLMGSAKGLGGGPASYIGAHKKFRWCTGSGLSGEATVAVEAAPEAAWASMVAMV